ncbi:hypothetical protein [Thermofilum sp.]|uniref:hypothetical protein n=1 Tax=Thermofilum sp. TaxID=1961369 RepID=UPI003162D7A7
MQSCEAGLWAMRVAAWAGNVKAWAAARGSGKRGQPTTATDDHEPHNHTSLNKGSTTHVNPRILRLYTTLHCLPQCPKDSLYRRPLGPSRLHASAP